MNTRSNEGSPSSSGLPPVYVISGGLGTSGEQLVRTVLAQFAGNRMPLEIIARVREPEQVVHGVHTAAQTGGIIVHTMVNAGLRARLVQEAAAHSVPAIDLMGPLMTLLAEMMGEEPIGQPGLFRQLHETYFDRIEAIEYTVAHDDGKKTEDLDQAEIVLLGVSRVGKTPLSMYLSVLGWKVANVPLVYGLAPPPQIFQIDRRRVVGLTIEPPQLLSHRQWRQQHMGFSGGNYAGRENIITEIRDARHLFARHDIPVVDVSNKPIETSADEVVSIVTRRLGHPD